MKKILYIFCSQNYGGAEIVMQRLICANKNSIYPIILCPPGEFATSLSSYGIKVIESPHLSSLERRRDKFNKLKLFSNIVRKLILLTHSINNISKEFNITLIHANNISAAFYSLPFILYSKIFQKKIISLWSDHDMSYPDKFTNKIARTCYRFFNKTLVVSKAVQMKYPQYLSRSTVLYNGLSHEEFYFDKTERDEFRDEYKISKDFIVIGIVGTISFGKGQKILIKTFKKLLTKYNNIILMIIGKFSTVEESYKTEIQEEILGFPQCILTGPLKEMKKIYSGIDILVNASTSKNSESLGTTIYEAMACERIVLASRTGGSPEIIDENINGFLYEADNSSDLFNKLNFIINNLEQLVNVRKAALNKTVNAFNIKLMLRNYNLIINQLLKTSTQHDN